MLKICKGISRKSFNFAWGRIKKGGSGTLKKKHPQMLSLLTFWNYEWVDCYTQFHWKNKHAPLAAANDIMRWLHIWPSRSGEFGNKNSYYFPFSFKSTWRYNINLFSDPQLCLKAAKRIWETFYKKVSWIPARWRKFGPHV